MKTIYTIHMRGNGPLSVDPFDSKEDAERFCEEHNSELLFPDDLMIAEEEVKTWEDFMPSSVTLHYVDYRDDLNERGDILAKCLKYNDFSAIYDLFDNDFYYFDHYLDEIRSAMVAEDLEEEYEEYIEDIKEYLWEHDDSDVVKDLLRNTSAVACYFDLGKWLCQPYSANDRNFQQLEIRKKLNISKEQYEKVKELVDWNGYGGYLRIYFLPDWGELINYQTKENDWRQIYFKGSFPVAIFNPTEGAGGYVEMDLDVKFPFNRENVFVSGQGERYSLESLYGMYNSWIKDFDTPELSNELETRRQIGESQMNAHAEREARFIKIFKEGGCTLGDTNMNRHRGVFYKNEYPCGWHCPHCGQFWID